MAYVKQEWKNLPNQTTPANATRMNHIEDGIYNNSVEISNIIGSGSNSNGSWVKFSDGTLIQYGLLVKTLTITKISSQTDWYYDDGYVVKFPINFANINYVVDVKSAVANLVTMNVYSITDYATNLCKVNLSNKISITVENHSFRWLAIGRWK